MHAARASQSHVLSVGALMSSEPWRAARVAPDGTHHLVHGEPMYAARFDEVLTFHAPGLAPVCALGEAWHINELGEPAYARRFVRTFGFYEGLAAVQGTDGWHHVHPDGRDLSSVRYAWCGNFQGGRCAVRSRDGLYHHLDVGGQAAYPQRYRYAGDFRDGVAVVQGEDGRSSHIDEAGRSLHPESYLDLDVFHKGFARARDEGGWMHVDEAGRPVYRRRFALVEPFYNGQARVERQDGGLEIISERGDNILELRPALNQRAEAAAREHERSDGSSASSSSSGLRILLIGLPGAGKTTLAAFLYQRFGLPLFAMDGFRRAHGDGTVAGDCQARAHFLRACGTEARAVFEFSAVGIYRFETATALSEHPAPLLTIWVDAADGAREERLTARGGRIPWPRDRADATREELEAKGREVLRRDFERGFWKREPRWHAHRLDTTRSLEESQAELVRLVETCLAREEPA